VLDVAEADDSLESTLHESDSASSLASLLRFEWEAMSSVLLWLAESAGADSLAC